MVRRPIPIAEQGVATNRLPVACRKHHGNSPINFEIGARSQAACGSTLTLASEEEMSDMITLALYGGPCDGERIQIHRDHLDLKARIEIQREGQTVVYGVDDSGRLVWLPDPQSERVLRGIFVCDDDGKVISEEPTTSDAIERLEDLGDEGSAWKYD